MIYIDYDPVKAGSAPTTPTILSGVTKDANGQPVYWSVELKPGRNVFDQNGGNKTAELVRSHDNYDWYDQTGSIHIDESDIDITVNTLKLPPKEPVVIADDAAPNALVTPTVNAPGEGEVTTEGGGTTEVTPTPPPTPPPTPTPSSKTARGKKLPESELPPE